MNRLMSLLRKEGHSEFGVFLHKLRNKAPGIDQEFSRGLDLLTGKGCVETRGEFVFMTPHSVTNMYQPRLLGRPDYDPHDEYWEPIISDLDRVFKEDWMRRSANWGDRGPGARR